MDVPDGRNIRRLAQAFALLHSHKLDADCSDAEFLAAHEEFRDILTPLLAGADAAALLTSEDGTVETDHGAIRDWLGQDHELQTVGPFRILGSLGEGGMGVVYLAEQTAPIRRLVALKLIRSGMASKQAMARFDAERQALALMNHPNVARVFDAGETAEGRPYFAMEYVTGEPITSYCDRNRLDLRSRLQLFVQVCHGIHHAHQKAIIHRDLKPSNVLVSERDGEAVPVIIDFGIAKALRGELTDQTILERTGHLVGTPEYMSPEQVAGQIGEIDTRTDVYALGLLLHELLVGVHAFDLESLRSSSLTEVERIICGAVPRRPSVRFAALSVAEGIRIAELRQISPAALQRALGGDLDWIILKTLEKEPDRRYPSALMLSGDVQRSLRFEPVIARAPSNTYIFKRFLRRRRGLVAAASSIFVVLAASFAIALWQANAEQKLRTEYDQLSNIVLLEKAIAATAELQPAHPGRLDAIREWLVKHAEPLLTQLPGLRSALATVAGRGENGVSAQPVFAKHEDEFVYENLRRLTAALAEFESGLVAEIRRRESWATRITELSIERHADAWSRARAAVAAADGVSASTEYRSDPPFDLAPQIGLVPIGMNPVTRLWEFHHLRSAAPDAKTLTEASFDGTGGIDVEAGTGIVFVLIPGGEFVMGSQSTDRGEPNFDGESEKNEHPTHRVRLAPFFIARHELTQGQWKRLSDGEEPAALAGKVSLDYPVESVNWPRCNALMLEHGLALPTEAQWEYACRAGTGHPWWTGGRRETLLEGGPAANLADRSAGRAGLSWREIGAWPEYDDGFVLYAQVDTLRPNPWGLFHVHGNLFEWCRDWYGSYQVQPNDGDGLREPSKQEVRIVRGGSFRHTANGARCANRNFFSPLTPVNVLGLRASRGVY